MRDISYMGGSCGVLGGGVWEGRGGVGCGF